MHSSNKALKGLPGEAHLTQGLGSEATLIHLLA